MHIQIENSKYLQVLYDRDDKVKIYEKNFIGWLRLKKSNDAMSSHVYAGEGYTRFSRGTRQAVTHGRNESKSF